MMMNWSKGILSPINVISFLFLISLSASSFIPKLTAQHVFIMPAEKTQYYSTRDSVDLFFDRIQPLEVSIQLKDSAIMHLKQADASQLLQVAMRKQGVTPDSSQNQVLRSAMDEALRLSQSLLKKYPLPDTIRVGIIQGDLYGPSVFYTRENGIYVPEPMVKAGNRKMLTTVLIHEIFHIQSRNYPKLQEKLYAHLGFKKLDLPIIYPKSFISQTLLNPDGTDWDYYIPLSIDDKKVFAFPLIVSKKSYFDPAEPNFFSYLKFQLFPLQRQKEGYKLSYEGDFNGLDSKWMTPFFERITKNTNYIIHPDELMADNFVFLTKWIEKETAPDNISESGKGLLRKLASEYEVKLP